MHTPLLIDPYRDSLTTRMIEQCPLDHFQWWHDELFSKRVRWNGIERFAGLKKCHCTPLTVQPGDDGLKGHWASSTSLMQFRRPSCQYSVGQALKYLEQASNRFRWTVKFSALSTSASTTVTVGDREYLTTISSISEN